VTSTGRPRIPEERKRKKLNVTIPARLIEAAAKQAEKEGVELSRFVERAVESQLAADAQEEGRSGNEGKSSRSIHALTALDPPKKRRNA